jgi:hypothetical protein
MHASHVSRSALLLALVTFTGCATNQPVTVPTDQDALSRVNAIYLGDFGPNDASALVREKIRQRLLGSDRFAVVETPDKADALLVGSAGVEKSVADKSTEYTEFGLLRLVDARTQNTIWAHEYRRPSFVMIVGDVSSRLADQMVERLLAQAGARH